MSLKLAFVSPRYGEEIVGGAEILCRQLAERLALEFDIEVFTTCASDFTTWRNTFQPGRSVVNSVPVTRFLNEFERVPTFHKLYRDLIGEDPTGFVKHPKRIIAHLKQTTDAAQVACIKAAGPYSLDLIEYIEDRQHEYDLVVFFTYLSALSFFGMRRVPSRKTVLVPTTHNEPAAYFPIMRKVFQTPAGIVYLTGEEEKLAENLYMNSGVRHETIGMGIEMKYHPIPNRFREKYGIKGRFALYAGRIDKAKGCETMIDDFNRAVIDEDLDAQLIMIGNSFITVPDSDRVSYLGFLPEEDKWDAYAAADVLIQPSAFESFSITILESMFCGTPVLVNAKSDVLKQHCKKSRAGLYYENTGEFGTALAKLLKDQDLNNQLGRNGHQYVVENYEWKAIRDRYASFLNELAGFVNK